MKIIYFLLVILPVYIEFSHYIKTDGVIRKIALGTLSVSSLIALSGNGTDFICIAILGIYCEKLIHFQVQKFKQKQNYNIETEDGYPYYLERRHEKSKQ